jgi:hypothetical protein
VSADVSSHSVKARPADSIRWASEFPTSFMSVLEAISLAI